MCIYMETGLKKGIFTHTMTINVTPKIFKYVTGMQKLSNDVFSQETTLHLAQV